MCVWHIRYLRRYLRHIHHNVTWQNNFVHFLCSYCKQCDLVCDHTRQLTFLHVNDISISCPHNYTVQPIDVVLRLHISSWGIFLYSVHFFWPSCKWSQPISWLINRPCRHFDESVIYSWAHWTPCEMVAGESEMSVGWMVGRWLTPNTPTLLEFLPARFGQK